MKSTLEQLRDMRQSEAQQAIAAGKAEIVKAKTQRQMPHQLHCTECRLPFGAMTNRAKYCSDRCRQQSYRDSKREYLPDVEIDCHECGDTFDVSPRQASRAMYCSPRCRQRNRRREIAMHTGGLYTPKE